MAVAKAKNFDFYEESRSKAPKSDEKRKTLLDKEKKLWYTVFRSKEKHGILFVKQSFDKAIEEKAFNITRCGSVW